MSATLMYQIVKPQGGKHLSDELKYAIRDKYFDGEHKAIITPNDEMYFRGLADGGIKDAKKIADLLQKGESIEIWQEY